MNGNRHDLYCLSESGVLLACDPGNWRGDKGYIDKDMITPIKKPAHRELLDWEKSFNTQVSKIRYVIEQTNANSKTWRIMHTDYRRNIRELLDTKEWQTRDELANAAVGPCDRVTERKLTQFAS